MLWRASVLDQDGQLEPSLKYTVDWDLSLRLLRQGPPAAVSQPLVAFRQHGSNMSTKAGTYLSEMRLIEEKFADLLNGQTMDVAYQYRNAGSESLRAGRRRDALGFYRRAFGLGDSGSALRALAVLTPRRVWPLLRRWLLSDRGWMQAAEDWLGPYRGRPKAGRLVVPEAALPESAT
jgi:hypothetical protein